MVGDLHQRRGYRRRQRRHSQGDKRPSIVFQPQLYSGQYDRIPFVRGLSLTSGIPRAKQVHATGEEASFEHSQQNSAHSQLSVILNEAHADHNTAPEHSDASQMNARSDLTDEDGRGRLEDDVGDEEDQVGNVL